jgi:3-dehydroquinate dehydratase II
MLHIINGPNLNLLGKREPQVYGTQSFEDYFKQLSAQYADTALCYFQSNHEGALIDYIHEIGFLPATKGIIINAGAYTHTSIALADALSAIPVSNIIEVHISNIHARESFRHHSYLASVCKGSIVGLGLDGYRLAIEWHLRNDE